MMLGSPKEHHNKEPKEEDKMDKSRNEKGLSHDRPNYQRHDRSRLHDMLYNTTWKEGKHVINN